MGKSRILGAGLFILGAILALTPGYILPVCDVIKGGHRFAACTYMGRIAAWAGLGACLLSVAVFFTRRPGPFRWLMALIFLTGAGVVALPQMTGYCMSPSMPCNYGTVPMLRLVGGLMGLVSAAGFCFFIPAKGKSADTGRR